MLPHSAAGKRVAACRKQRPPPRKIQPCSRRRPFAGLDYPLLETRDEWVVHGFSFANYLAELGDNAQTEIFVRSSLDAAMRDAFRKMRHFLMATKGLTEDEAISLMSVAVDFGVTQVVDANWGVHAILKKAIFANDTR